MYNSEVVLLVKTKYFYDLVEWICYYLKLGFDHITIYNNDSEVDIPNLIPQTDRISIINISGYPDQCNLERKHYRNTKYKWTFFADSDEFLWLDPKYKNVNHFLEIKDKELNCDAIGVYWVKVSSNPVLNDRKDIPECTQIKSFKYIQNIENESWLKCFYKQGNTQWQSMEIHYPSPAVGVKSVNGNTLNVRDVRKQNYDYSNDDAIVYHYYHKSWDEFYTKMRSTVATRPVTYTDEFPECQFTHQSTYIKLLFNVNYSKYFNKLEEYLYG